MMVLPKMDWRSLLSCKTPRFCHPFCILSLKNASSSLQAGKFNWVSLKAIAKKMHCQLFIDPPIREIPNVRNGFILLFITGSFGLKSRFHRLCNVKYL